MLTFKGLGYTEEFSRNFDLILARIRDCEDIEIADGPDDICRPRLDDNEDQDVHCHLARIRDRDRLALDAIGRLLEMPLVASSRMTLTVETLERLREGFLSGALRSACFECQWAPLCTDLANADFTGTRLAKSYSS